MYRMRGDSSSIEGLRSLVKEAAQVKDKLTVIEVGSFAGESAEVMLETGNVEKIICIDPWISGYDETDFASKEEMALVEAAFDKRVGSDNRVEKFKGTLVDFLHTRYTGDENIPVVDLVYIDACHQYDPVKNDIINSLLYVKPIVAISGHDYHSYIIRDAIKDVFGRNPDKIFDDSSWLFHTKQIMV